MPGLWQQSNAQRMADTIKLRGIAADTKSRSLDRQQRGWELAGTSVLGAVKSRQGMRFEAREAEKERGFLGDQAGLAAQERKDEATLGRRHTVATASELAGTQAGESKLERANRIAVARLRAGSDDRDRSQALLTAAKDFMNTDVWLTSIDRFGNADFEKKVRSHFALGGFTEEETERGVAYLMAMMVTTEDLPTEDGDTEPGEPWGGRLQELPEDADISGMDIIQVGSIIEALRNVGVNSWERATLNKITREMEGDRLTSGTMERLEKMMRKYDIGASVGEVAPPVTPLPANAEQLRKSLELMKGAGLQQQPAIRTQEDLLRFLGNRGQ